MRKYLAEFIGTFVLVFGGCGAAIFAGEKIGFAGVALAFGLTLLTMAYAIGPVSGCHINPSVTFGLLLSKRIGGKDAGAYMIAQVLGAIVASAILLTIAKGIAGGYDPATGGFAANGYGDHSPMKYHCRGGPDGFSGLHCARYH